MPSIRRKKCGQENSAIPVLRCRIVCIRFSIRGLCALRGRRVRLFVENHPRRGTHMADESKTTQALLRALLKEMEKTLAEPKPYERPEGHGTRVNVKEFERGQQEGNWWDDSDGDGSAPFGLDLRPKPAPKPRAKRRPR